MKLPLFVLVLSIFNIAENIASTTQEMSTTEVTSSTTAISSTTVETTVPTDDATEPVENSDDETTTVGVPDGGGTVTTMSADAESTPTAMPVDENATTTTTAMPVDENSTTTTTAMPVDENATTTTTVMPVDENATTTTPMPVDENATTTTTAMPVDENATTTTTAMPVDENATTTTTAMPVDENATTTTTPMPGAEENDTDTTTQQQTEKITSTPEINPCLNATVVQQCKDQDFTTCVHDGPGRHHCEGCLGGWTLSNGTCKRLPRVIGKVVIQFINGAEASFTVDLTNRDSAAFIRLATDCCASFLRASIAVACDVTSFTEGSIIVAFVLGFPENATDINETALAQNILDDANATGIGLNPNVELRTNTMFCEDTTCENDGICYINESMLQCNCTDGYTGSSCAISPTTTVVTVTDQPGLTTTVIIGIAVGVTAAVLIIIIIIIVVVLKCGGKNKVVSQEEMNTHSDEVPLQKR
ncbi:uncharacterized protein [Asterias amurensis]|uniref:uncharacterized protein n=1 Tax=Asterias amurensis TaxID=7602 RepID=UPI003AB5341D